METTKLVLNKVPKLIAVIIILMVTHNITVKFRMEYIVVLCEVVDNLHHKFIAYHPQTHKQTQQMKRLFKNMLQHYISQII